MTLTYDLKNEKTYYCIDCGKKLKYRKTVIQYDYLTGKPCKWLYQYVCFNNWCDNYSVASLESNVEY